MTKRDKDFIVSLLQDNRWTLIEQIMDQLIIKWNDEQCKSDTEFETLWKLAFKEGKVAGLKDFKNLLIQQAND